jgi:hypothetical protein
MGADGRVAVLRRYFPFRSVSPLELLIEVPISDIDDESTRISELQKIAVCLPHFNRETMRVINTFLKDVADLCMFNRMTISNLSVIFGPCFLPLPNDGAKVRTQEISKDIFQHAEKQVTLTRDFITFHALVFSPLPLDDPRAPHLNYIPHGLTNPIPIQQASSAKEDGGSGSFKRPRAERFYRAGAPPVGGWINGVGQVPTSPPQSPDDIQTMKLPSSQSPKPVARSPANLRQSGPTTVASGIAKFGGSGSPSSPMLAKKSSVQVSVPKAPAKMQSQPGLTTSHSSAPPPKHSTKGSAAQVHTLPSDHLRLNTVAPMRRRPMSILMQIPTAPLGIESGARARISDVVSLSGTPRSKIWPRLLRVTEDDYQILVEALPVSSDYVCSEDSFILDNDSELIVWHGVKSNDLKRSRASAIQAALNLDRKGTRVRSTVLEQGIHGDALFFDKTGGRPSYLPDSLSINGDASTPSIFLLSATSGTAQMTQLAAGDGRLRRSILHQSEVYLIDLGFELYVWIGKDSSPSDCDLIPVFTKEYIDSFSKLPSIHVTAVKQPHTAESSLLSLYLC